MLQVPCNDLMLHDISMPGTAAIKLQLTCALCTAKAEHIRDALHPSNWHRTLNLAPSLC